MSVTKKTALITGGSRGLGAAIAKRLAREGVAVTIAARGSSDLDELATNLGLELSRYAIELNDETEFDVFLDYVEISKFDINVNNAGGNLNLTNPLDNYDSFKEVMSFNLGIAVNINSRALPNMIEQGWGRAVHFTDLPELMQNLTSFP